MRRFLPLLFCVFIFSCKDNEADVPAADPWADLQKQVRAYPDSLPLVERLVQHYREEGNYDSALAITAIALQKKPATTSLWDMQATLQFENGDTLKAIRSFEEAIRIYPLPEYVMSLGTLYAQTKDIRALTMADTLAGADKTGASKEAIFIKGLYYNYSNDKKKAIALFDSCIHMDYTYMFAYREKAIALYDMGRYAEAVKVLERAVTVQNNFDEGYFWLGNCYKKLGRKTEAAENYHRALMYDKDFQEARDSLAKVESER